MTDNFILAVNGGSSSLKCALYHVGAASPELKLRANVAKLADQPYCKIIAADGEILASKTLNIIAERERSRDALVLVLGELRQYVDLDAISAIGHRVVHGGDLFLEPVSVDAEILTKLRGLIPLAPLHQPININLIEACTVEFPDVTQMACFDTAFHAGMPSAARSYALPQELTDSGIHAYGFHGLSYEYIWDRLQTLDKSALEKRVVVAHFGAGASLCAMRAGKSIATTMGFSTMDGMPMATRVGGIDPGVLIYLLRDHEMSVDQIEELLYKKCGLLAVSGLSGDMRMLSESDDPRARSAIDYFVYRASREIASLAGALGGLDTLVFTGGIGANEAAIRRDICVACRWLNVEVDAAANANGAETITSANSKIDVHVLATDEETQIARHVMQQIRNGVDS